MTPPMDEPAWSEPPPSRAGSQGAPLRDYVDALAAQLRQKPGEWAEVYHPNYRDSPMTKAAAGNMRIYLKRVGVYATQRRDGSGTYRVWAQAPMNDA